VVGRVSILASRDVVTPPHAHVRNAQSHVEREFGAPRPEITTASTSPNDQGKGCTGWCAVGMRMHHHPLTSPTRHAGPRVPARPGRGHRPVRSMLDSGARDSWRGLRDGPTVMARTAGCELAHRPPTHRGRTPTCSVTPLPELRPRSAPTTPSTRRYSCPCPSGRSSIRMGRTDRP
jgi:hypothetical protein